VAALALLVRSSSWSRFRDRETRWRNLIRRLCSYTEARRVFTARGVRLSLDDGFSKTRISLPVRPAFAISKRILRTNTKYCSLTALSLCPSSGSPTLGSAHLGSDNLDTYVSQLSLWGSGAQTFVFGNDYWGGGRNALLNFAQAIPFAEILARSAQKMLEIDTGQLADPQGVKRKGEWQLLQFRSSTILSRQRRQSWFVA